MSLTFRVVAATSLLLMIVGRPASAGYTPINPPAPGEKSIPEILNHVYGGDFVARGNGYENGSIIAHRIEDILDAESVASPLDFVFGDPAARPNPEGGTIESIGGVTDQLWTGDHVDAVATARFALYSQRFGYKLGTSGGSYQNVFDLEGSGFDVSGSGSLDGVSGQIWRWARSGDFGLLTSQNLDNSDSLDHMVTYQILEAARESQITRYLLCWEDRTPSQASDFDFNDLVVEIEVSVAPIPEPSAFLTLCGLAAGTMFGSRRRR